jgi:hypothetical protein
MTVQEELLAECAKLNVRLRPTSDGRLAIGARQALPSILLEKLKAQKVEILKALAANPCADDPQTVAGPKDCPVHSGRTGSAHRLCDNGFPAITPKMPPPSILAAPRVLCPRCNRRAVLQELRTLTNGQCYECAVGEGVGHR